MMVQAALAFTIFFVKLFFYFKRHLLDYKYGSCHWCLAFENESEAIIYILASVPGESLTQNEHEHIRCQNMLVLSQ